MPIKLRERLQLIFDPDVELSASQRFRLAQFLMIVVGIVATVVDSLPGLDRRVQFVIETLLSIIGLAFAVEYGLRVWVAPVMPAWTHLKPWQARLRWMLSVGGLIDFLAMLPIAGGFTWGMILSPDFAAVLVLALMLKLSAHTPGTRLIGQVIYNERRSLLVVLIIFCVVLVAAATVQYLAEGKSQPDVFGSIPHALWWAVVTLTTTGYGDVVPQTLIGRLVAGAVMICGIGVLALLAAILSTGFSEEVKRREFLRIWELVSKVPLFNDAGSHVVAEVVGRLKAHYFPAGALVVRRGAPGDSMYFIASGEVEVKLQPNSIVLSDGSFFGEMALLDRRPRSADVVTLSACTLLVLGMVDFYQLAGQYPALTAAIEAAARERRQENLEPPAPA